jgi:hypothetical protein
LATSRAFLRGRFQSTYLAASSADWSRPTSAINCSRNAAACCTSNVGRAGRAACSPGHESAPRRGWRPTAAGGEDVHEAVETSRTST